MVTWQPYPNSELSNKRIQFSLNQHSSSAAFLKIKKKIPRFISSESLCLPPLLHPPHFLHTCRGWQQSLKGGWHGNSKQVAAGYRGGVAGEIKARLKYFKRLCEASFSDLLTSGQSLMLLTDIPADGYHRSESQAQLQRGLNKKKLKDKACTAQKSYTQTWYTDKLRSFYFL